MVIAPCSVTFENLCFFSNIGQLEYISHEAVKRRFAIEDVFSLCAKDKWGNSHGALHLKHLREFIRLVVELKAREASNSICGSYDSTKKFFPKSMNEFEDGVVDYIMVRNFPHAIYC